MANSTQRSSVPGIPDEPIDRWLSPVAHFLHIETASGIVLLVATAIALAAANSPWSDKYQAFWDTPIDLSVGSFVLSHTLGEWINDGLMAIFFFVVGLEVKRELVVGELREMRRAALPIAAALGGTIAPALIYLSLQHGTEGARGWGIPMATDIAFVVGCMALLGRRVPHGLRVVLLSLAIADDIGAILVIAIGYTEHLSWPALGTALVLIGVLLLLSRLGVRNLGVYTLLGFGVWLAFLKSGVHATIAGVILGLLTPAREYLGPEAFRQLLDRFRTRLETDWSATPHRIEPLQELRWAARETVSPLEFLERTLHPWVGFVIMPIFALANANVPIGHGDLGSSLSVAVVLGLVIGKPAGIVAASWLAVRCRLAQLPDGVGWRMMCGAGCLAGIGFTMALFIADLALEGPLLLKAKVGVLAGSAASAVLGTALFLALGRRRPAT